MCGTRPRSRHRFLPLVAIFIMAALPHGAIAQLSYNTNILPLGDKEALLGNTGTGGLGSTGAVFYNPAALTLLEGSSFSLSGSAYMQYSFKTKPFAVIDGNVLDYSGSGFQSVPTSLVMARSLGTWKVAFSLLVPTQFKYEGQQDWRLTVGGTPYRLKILQNYSEAIFMGGLSVARKINDRWSWGVSVYGQYFSYLSFSDVRFSNIDDPTKISLSSSRDQRAPVSLYVLAGLHRQGEVGTGSAHCGPQFPDPRQGGLLQLHLSGALGGIAADRDRDGPHRPEGRLRNTARPAARGHLHPLRQAAPGLGRELRQWREV
jgi:hypothetical protein